MPDVRAGSYVRAGLQVQFENSLLISLIIIRQTHTSELCHTSELGLTSELGQTSNLKFISGISLIIIHTTFTLPNYICQTSDQGHTSNLKFISGISLVVINTLYLHHARSMPDVRAGSYVRSGSHVQL